MLHWVLSSLDRFSRNSDVKRLWPVCKDAHPHDIEAARASFYDYLLDKDAWTDHYLDAEIAEFVKSLG